MAKKSPNNNEDEIRGTDEVADDDALVDGADPDDLGDLDDEEEELFDDELDDDTY